MNWTFDDFTWEYLTNRFSLRNKTLSQKMASKNELNSKIVDAKLNSLYGSKNHLLDVEINLVIQQNNDNLQKIMKLKKLRVCKINA